VYKLVLFKPNPHSLLLYYDNPFLINTICGIEWNIARFKWILQKSFFNTQISEKCNIIPKIAMILVFNNSMWNKYTIFEPLFSSLCINFVLTSLLLKTKQLRKRFKLLTA